MQARLSQRLTQVAGALAAAGLFTFLAPAAQADTVRVTVAYYSDQTEP